MIKKLSQNNEYKDKKNFLKFLCSEFILKAKLINECKNFKNHLLIARNNSLSFNDVLKTLGEKMNANLNQLNNKIEVLIQNDQKFINFMKFQEASLKSVRNLIRIQDNIINYLIEKNNEAELIYFRENKEKQEKFVNALKNIGNNSGIPKMKSFAYGPFGFNKKFGTKNNENYKINIIKPKKENKAHGVKKMRSSIVATNNPSLKMSSKHLKTLATSKSNVLKNVKKPIKRKISLDDKALNIFKNIKNEHEIKKDIIEKVILRKNSETLPTQQIIDKLTDKFE